MLSASIHPDLTFWSIQNSRARPCAVAHGRFRGVCDDYLYQDSNCAAGQNG